MSLEVRFGFMIFKVRMDGDFFIKQVYPIKNNKIMNIAFLSTINPYDQNAWSGTSYHLLQILSNRHKVEVVGYNTIVQTSYFNKRNFLKENRLERYGPVFGKFYEDQILDSDS